MSEQNPLSPVVVESIPAPETSAGPIGKRLARGEAKKRAILVAQLAEEWALIRKELVAKGSLDADRELDKKAQAFFAKVNSLDEQTRALLSSRVPFLNLNRIQ